MFNVMDVDGSGELNPREIAESVSRLIGSEGEANTLIDEVSNMEIFKIWHTVDENNDALVSWDEFLKGEGSHL